MGGGLSLTTRRRYAHNETSMSTTSKRRRLEPWVGPWLRSHREGLDIKREAIAKKIGRDLSAVARIETGAARIPADDLPIVLAAYKLTEAHFASEAARQRRAAA